MGYVVMICPSCGAQMEIEDNKEIGYCQYCGTKVVREKQVIKLTGTVAVAGTANETSLLERAYMFLEDGDFISANRYLERVLDINPTCAKAYMGKTLVDFRTRNLEQLRHSPYRIIKNANYLKALQFSKDSERRGYEEIDQIVVKGVLVQKGKMEDSIRDMKAKLELTSHEQMKADGGKVKRIARRILWTVCLVVAIILFPFTLLMVIAVKQPTTLIIFVPATAFLAFCIYKYHRVLLRAKQHLEKTRYINCIQSSINAMEAELKQYLRNNDLT